MAHRTVSGYTVKLETHLSRDGRDWVAEAPALKLASQDRTKKGSLEALREAVEAWFDSCIERGVLDQALEEVGFKKEGKGASPEEAANLVGAHYKEQNPAPDRLHFSVSARKGSDYIEGVIPAYIAAHQLGESGRATYGACQRH